MRPGNTASPLHIGLLGEGYNINGSDTIKTAVSKFLESNDTWLIIDADLKTITSAAKLYTQGLGQPVYNNFLKLDIYTPLHIY